ncbi:DUF397 domain-containing protein [Streptomyces sp. NBC_00631]|uniref:DUF397 domain-containing protein n=1 Tax=Streptomyces sp. NBC_00631 TaxID=2975793 RepID=UPI0030E22FCD
MTNTLHWFKSSRSNASGGDCLEISPCPGTVHIRDSKTAPAGPHLTVSPVTWARFLRHQGSSPFSSK